jgi:hypothetical protein
VDEQPLSAREFGAAFKGFLEQAVTEAPEEGSTTRCTTSSSRAAN